VATLPSAMAVAIGVQVESGTKMSETSTLSRNVDGLKSLGWVWW
jgi:hypothetical protein